MYRHRELLTSLLASAMLSAYLLPSAGTTSLASVIDTAAASRAVGAGFSRLPDGGWAAPDMESLAEAMKFPAVIAVAQGNPGEDKPIITKERLKFLHDFAILNPNTTSIGRAVAVPIGLADDAIEAKSMSFEDQAGTHRFYAPAKPIGKIMFSHKKDGVLTVFASDMNGKLLGAGTYAKPVFTPIPLDAAKAAFEVELRLWSVAEHQEPPANS